jgi:hypothetical protein
MPSFGKLQTVTTGSTNAWETLVMLLLLSIDTNF